MPGKATVGAEPPPQGDTPGAMAAPEEGSLQPPKKRGCLCCRNNQIVPLGKYKAEAAFWTQVRRAAAHAAPRNYRPLRARAPCEPAALR